MPRIYEVYPPVSLGDSPHAPKMVIGIDDGVIGVNGDGTCWDDIPVSVEIKDMHGDTEVFRYIQLDQLDDMIITLMYAKHRITEFRKENGYEAPPEAQG